MPPSRSRISLFLNYRILTPTFSKMICMVMNQKNQENRKNQENSLLAVAVHDCQTPSANDISSNLPAVTLKDLVTDL